MKPKNNFLRIGGLAILGLLCVAILIGLAWTFLKPDPVQRERDNYETAAAQTDTPGLEELTDLATFRAAYLEANGGREAINRLQSLQVTGTIESDGSTVPFRTVKKRPNKGIFIMSMPEYEVSLVVNGDVVWQRVEQPGMEPVNTLMPDDEAHATRNLGYFFDTTMHILLDEPSAIERLAADSWESTETLRMDFSSAERTAAGSVHFDPDTLQPIVQIQKSGEDGQRMTRYEDYRAIEDGIQQPFRSETFLNGDLVNRTKIEKVATNPGILDFIFEYPAEEGPNS
ncbi:MAG: hypothetical protein ACLFS1_08915 [Opitutales bacterium]